MTSLGHVWQGIIPTYPTESNFWLKRVFIHHLRIVPVVYPWRRIVTTNDLLSIDVIFAKHNMECRIWILNGKMLAPQRRNEDRLQI